MQILDLLAAFIALEKHGALLVLLQLLTSYHGFSTRPVAEILLEPLQAGSLDAELRDKSL